MSATEALFLLFPIAMGEEDVHARGEVPVLVTAVADTSVTSQRGAYPPGSHQQQQQQQPGGSGSVLSLISAASAHPSSAEAAALELCRTHYIATSHLCTVQYGKALARCLPQSQESSMTLLAPANGCAELIHGRRCHYVCPVEDGRYLATLCLPSTLSRHLSSGGDGTSLAHWLLHTTLACHPLPPSALRPTGADDTTCYTPLHTRLTESAEAVQQSMAAQLHRLSRLATAEVTSTPRLAALHRLLAEEPSALRVHPRLGQRVEALIRSAVSPTSDASLRGVLPTMGLTRATPRYVVRASALWYRGHPLYTSVTPAAQQQSASCSSVVQLRSAAVSVLLDEMEKLTRAAGAAYTDAESAPVKVTARCCATASPGQHTSYVSTSANGYVSQSLYPATPPSRLPGGVSMALTSSSGWTLSLLLQPIRTPCVGAPLSVIFGGVQSLVAEGVEREDFFNLVQSATVAMRQTTWRRPLHHVSPLVAQLEAAVVRIVVRQRMPGTAAASQDRVLYSLQRGRATATRTTAAGPTKRSASPLTSLCWTNTTDKTEKKRRAALLGSYAEAERRRCLSENDKDGCGEHIEADVLAVVQTAMRYGDLMLRVQRCRGGGFFSQRAPPPPPLPQQQQCGQSRAVLSVLTGSDKVRLVRAVPHCCNVAAAPARLRYAVTYVVVEVDKKTMPAPSFDAYQNLTTWIAGRCL